MRGVRADIAGEGGEGRGEEREERVGEADEDDDQTVEGEEEGGGGPFYAVGGLGGRLESGVWWGDASVGYICRQ